MSTQAHTGRRTRRIPYKSDHGGVHASGPQSSINVTPLVDVCLVLLIIFMVVTPMLGRGKDVQLPTLVEADQHKEGDQVFISVDDEGVWVNQDPYTQRKDFIEALQSEISMAEGKAAASGYTGPILFLKGDKSTNYGRVRVVMEWIQEANVQNIALVVDVGEG
ncbi:biopolymer transporter ExbD [Pseudenhygromyxa sp. WMMC2535]|uniref:ExbD/TolR family protein n=1 Tax=Pseudenhygromyxa sp. WMMC2535 TaxID=2712867 RepID=UPI001557976C|nr:biopolymer transporter ExbD [Pseudenhygromyxa sp. WMMC2535]NVB41859.1 biopolymer transporter ExbD [Pseudenhygromyxa sp. WMMC2535]